MNLDRVFVHTRQYSAMVTSHLYNNPHTDASFIIKESICGPRYFLRGQIRTKNVGLVSSQ